MDSILVAFSGGVDSTLLLKVAVDVLKNENVLAVTAKSATFPQREIRKAVEIAGSLKAKHMIMESSELDNPSYINNDTQRCYFCKTELFEDLKKIAEREGIRFVADGQNYDDISDFRPGMKAALEKGVRSPLKESFLTKAEIRKLSKRLGLPNWSSPSFACLSSRISYGTQIRKELLERIDFLENLLLDLGFSQVRVRHHNSTARIEVLEQEMNKFNDPDIRMQIITKFKEQGYLYVTLDLEGYKTGSMNKILSKNP
ncbi:MAG: ATP-dependent sacrificial sulfur transferase LarE [Actinobacteria bacterium]|nr:ATP-dependent sacrificial sulfur transferase LarE [Actinomycetota bacterium]